MMSLRATLDDIRHMKKVLHNKYSLRTALWSAADSAMWFMLDELEVMFEKNIKDAEKVRERIRG